MHEQWAQTVIGLLALLVGAGVLAYALTAGSVGSRLGGYDVTAKFAEVGSLAPGAAVTVEGVEVGTVSAIRLDPKTHMTVTKLTLDSSVTLPCDSTANIRNALLGGVHVAIVFGRAADTIKPGGEIEIAHARRDKVVASTAWDRPTG